MSVLGRHYHPEQEKDHLHIIVAAIRNRTKITTVTRHNNLSMMAPSIHAAPDDPQ